MKTYAISFLLTTRPRRPGREPRRRARRRRPRAPARRERLSFEALGSARAPNTPGGAATGDEAHAKRQPRAGRRAERAYGDSRPRSAPFARDRRAGQAGATPLAVQIGTRWVPRTRPARRTLKSTETRVCRDFVSSRGGIRTREPRVMRSLEGGHLSPSRIRARPRCSQISQNAEVRRDRPIWGMTKLPRSVNLGGGARA